MSRSDDSGGKLTYSRPEFKDLGSVADLTRGGEDLPSSDSSTGYSAAPS
jgi:hypothetical protein